MWLWIVLALGGIVALAVIGTVVMPKLPSSPEEKQEMDEKAENKRIIKSGAITSKRKWLAIYIGLCFPIANLVILLVLAFKKERTNNTIRNWARANLILIVIGIVLSIAAVLVTYFFFNEVFTSYLNQLATMK